MTIVLDPFDSTPEPGAGDRPYEDPFTAGLNPQQKQAVEYRGESLLIVAGAGSGKTSVLNCVSGIYRGQGGIRFRGQDIAGRAPHEIARLGLARTFQHGELFAQMSVLDNLLTGRHARIRRAIIDKDVRVPSGFDIGWDRDADLARGLTVTEEGITVVAKSEDLERFSPPDG